MGLASRIVCALAMISGCACYPSRVQPPVFDDEVCRKTYMDFYQEPTVDIRVVFGYKDARPARFVADRYERMIFIQRILQECRPGNEACGFARSPDDSDLFQRNVRGPDGKERTVGLRVVQSSAGPDDEENRADPFQKWQTRHANMTFLDGLSKADAVFYNGHSRAGGGPDFEPPRIHPGGAVNFDSYKFHEPGFNQIISVLEGAPSRMKLLGLYSCASTKHFLSRVQALKPGLGLVTSPQLIYFSDALESSLEALSSILAMKCEVKRATRSGATRVSGFFD